MNKKAPRPSSRMGFCEADSVACKAGVHDVRSSMIQASSVSRGTCSDMNSAIDIWHSSSS